MLSLTAQNNIDPKGKAFDVSHITHSGINPHKSQGFTLIELMIVVVIIAILASIAIPSYRTWIRQNAEHQSMERALSISNELASWRSKRLTYSGFIPRNDNCGGSVDYCYSDNTPGKVYVPLGSTATSHRYELTLVDAATGAPLTNSNASGKGWRMLLKPNSSNTILASASSYYVDSLGQKCRYKKGATVPTLSSVSINCDTNIAGVTTW